MYLYFICPYGSRRMSRSAPAHRDSSASTLNKKVAVSLQQESELCPDTDPDNTSLTWTLSQFLSLVNLNSAWPHLPHALASLSGPLMCQPGLPCHPWSCPSLPPLCRKGASRSGTLLLKGHSPPSAPSRDLPVQSKLPSGR